jgi:hypothetical protein
MRYIIIKHIPITPEQILPVIMLDTHSEVWEFEHETDATDMAALLEANSYSGSKYEVKIV